MQEYFSILTNKGIDLLLKAAANKTQIALSKMSVSDDEGDLNQSITALNGVKHSFSINSLIVDEADPHQLIAEGVINADVGGFYINKAGIYTANDELFAVAKLPRTYKPKLAEGSAKDIAIRFIMQVDNANDITLKVDNNVVLATRNWAISNFAAKNHNHDERYVKKDDIPVAPQAATETEAGIVKLKNSITGSLADTAVSEKAAKEYMDKNASIGIGQTWQEVTSERHTGVTYTNTTGRPIFISVYMNSNSQGGSSAVEIFVDDKLISGQYAGRMGGITVYLSACAIVPSGSTYSAKTSRTLDGLYQDASIWMELR
jgi:hypothetical protein|nr:MAG TPA: tail collar fiber protein [Caudoviricetes sp.]